jgi:hypothetical protein
VFITLATLHCTAENVPDDLRVNQRCIIDAINRNINEQLLRVESLTPPIFDSSNFSRTDEREPEPNDSLFHARGLLKIKGRENYRNYGKFLGVFWKPTPKRLVNLHLPFAERV